MKAFGEWLKKWRHLLWAALVGDDEATWVAHFLLVAIGTFPFAAIAGRIWGSVVAVLVAFALSELWLLFMAGREVVDYLRAVYSGGDLARKKRDGIGDLVGPVVVHLFCWLALIGLIGGLYG